MMSAWLAYFVVHVRSLLASHGGLGDPAHVDGVNERVVRPID